MIGGRILFFVFFFVSKGDYQDDDESEQKNHAVHLISIFHQNNKELIVFRFLHYIHQSNVMWR